MAEVITSTYREMTSVIRQCDIFRNVEFLEYAIEEDDIIEVSKIIFPHVIVLTQACDLQQDFNNRLKIKQENESKQDNWKKQQKESNKDKLLISVIVAPLYNFEEFRIGMHLEQLDMKMEEQGRRSRSKCDNIIKNENKRYHYLNFAQNVPLVESVIDFKHYFTVTINYLESIYKDCYICSVDSLYRELIVQRFSNFLSRIGLPDENENSCSTNKIF